MHSPFLGPIHEVSKRRFLFVFDTRTHHVTTPLILLWNYGTLICIHRSNLANLNTDCWLRRLYACTTQQAGVWYPPVFGVLLFAYRRDKQGTHTQCTPTCQESPTCHVAMLRLASTMKGISGVSMGIQLITIRLPLLGLCLTPNHYAPSNRKSKNKQKETECLLAAA